MRFKKKKFEIKKYAFDKEKDILKTKYKCKYCKNFSVWIRVVRFKNGEYHFLKHCIEKNCERFNDYESRENIIHTKEYKEYEIKKSVEFANKIIPILFEK